MERERTNHAHQLRETSAGHGEALLNHYQNGLKYSNVSPHSACSVSRVSHTHLLQLAGCSLVYTAGHDWPGILRKQRGLLEGLPRAEAKLELSLSPSTDRQTHIQTGRDRGGPGWPQTLAVAASNYALPATQSQCSRMWCLVAQICQGMIWYEFETWVEPRLPPSTT